MSQYYNPNRKKNLYDKYSKDTYRLSSSKIDQLVYKLYDLTPEEIEIVEKG